MTRAHTLWQRSLVVNFLHLLRAWSNALIPNRVPYFGLWTRPDKGPQTISFANYASVPWSPWLAGRWFQAKETFEEGARFCRQQGIQLILCYVPDKFRVYQPFVEFPPGSPCERWSLWPLPGDFVGFCRSRQIKCLDLTGALQDSVRQRRMPYPPMDSHWGAEGHQIVAEVLEREIASLGN